MRYKTRSVYLEGTTPRCCKCSALIRGIRGILNDLFAFCSFDFYPVCNITHFFLSNMCLLPLSSFAAAQKDDPDHPATHQLYVLELVTDISLCLNFFISNVEMIMSVLFSLLGWKSIK